MQEGSEGSEIRKPAGSSAGPAAFVSRLGEESWRWPAQAEPGRHWEPAAFGGASPPGAAGGSVSTPYVCGPVFGIPSRSAGPKRHQERNDRLWRARREEAAQGRAEQGERAEALAWLCDAGPAAQRVSQTRVLAANKETAKRLG